MLRFDLVNFKIRKISHPGCLPDFHGFWRRPISGRVLEIIALMSNPSEFDVMEPASLDATRNPTPLREDHTPPMDLHLLTD